MKVRNVRYQQHFQYMKKLQSLCPPDPNEDTWVQTAIPTVPVGMEYILPASSHRARYFKWLRKLKTQNRRHGDKSRKG
jgi:hypothetical protein